MISQARVEFHEKETDSFNYRISDRQGHFIKVTLLEERGAEDAALSDSRNKQWKIEQDGLVIFHDAVAVKFTTSKEGELGIKYILRNQPVVPTLVFLVDLARGLSIKQQESSDQDEDNAILQKRNSNTEVWLPMGKLPIRKPDLRMLQNGERRKLQNAGDIDVVDETGKTIFQISSPVVYDTENRWGQAQFISPNENMLILSLGGDFLAKASYPITISTNTIYSFK